MNINEKNLKMDDKIKLYKNNENKDDIYLCSIFSLTSDKTKTNDSLYEFNATSNKIFYNGENKIQIEMGICFSYKKKYKIYLVVEW